MKIVVAITGASGSVVGIRLAEELEKTCEVKKLITKSGKKVIEHEMKKKIESDYEEDDFSSPLASSSNKIDAMIVCPCSVKALSAIANGYANNLVTRLADIQLKMKRRLILCVRETPFNLMHIENMRKVTLAGGIVMPLNMAYYFGPKTVDDVTDFFVGKVLDILGLENKLYKRWNNEP